MTRKRAICRVWFSANNLGPCNSVRLGSFYCPGNRWRRVTTLFSTWHVTCTQYLVVVITIRAAWKAISSWQHIQATRPSHAGKLGNGHRNHCHYHMQKYKGTADWKHHMLSFGLFTSHPTPHCPAHCQTYLWISAWRFVFTLSLLFFSLCVSNISSSFNRCLLGTCYMKSTVLGTREIEIYKCER